ncbi:MAG: PorT family protein [Chitinophagaceae bacterium]|nr:PorT family protein [Chitinophagaceae bacterium]
MKNKILLPLGLLFSISSFSQRITYGGAGGTNIANMRGDAVKNMQQLLNFTNDIVSTNAVTGYYAGGFVNIPVGNNFSIEPALYYTTKGYQLNGSYSVKDISFLTANATAKLNSSYIDMPVLLKANFNGLQVFAGPQVSLLTNASLKTTAGIAGFNLLNNKTDITSQFNQWDIAVTGGIGYQLSNGLRITAAYDRGLSKVNAGQSLSAYNQGFKIGAGFSF